MRPMPTIYAVSSGQGRAAVAVVRISGPHARRVLELMAGGCPPPRQAAFRRLRHPHDHELLDEALVLWFPGPRSETGEDLAELHAHGGRAVVNALLNSLGCIDGCRLAEPGEFIRRAFENGKLDLTQVEGLADLIDAETEAQRRQAVAHASGAAARILDAWRGRLVEALALVEAAIDFSDEPDVAADAVSRALADARGVADEISRHLTTADRGEIVRVGFQVVIAGGPNAGKSSLFNLLAKRDVAIVADEPGTTRDVLQVRLDLGGLLVVLSDTAGIREGVGPIEAEGIRRARAEAAQADLVLLVDDASDAAGIGLKAPEEFGGARAILKVRNKIDLVTASAASRDSGSIHVSARTGEGVADLVARIASIANERVSADEPALVTHARHRTHLIACGAALARVAAMSSAAEQPELLAEDLRRAVDEIGRITGRVGPEEVLGQIFGRFCIGK